jgi:hypothetical protein
MRRTISRVLVRFGEHQLALCSHKGTVHQLKHSTVRGTNQGLQHHLCASYFVRLLGTNWHQVLLLVRATKDDPVTLACALQATLCHARRCETSSKVLNPECSLPRADDKRVNRDKIRVSITASYGTVAAGAHNCKKNDVQVVAPFVPGAEPSVKLCARLNRTPTG